ncbi:hypothetical protein KUTeg_001356 [Tegillarca granosa]|uniref:Uncharacterized protein n=1 Tax=Tegillarca granosa TaxID=220873 RepID=A0ABQ9FR67_TEGGR|nr:hypothetical protein KUTeg_001356 [Tegillarca granosa]
MCVEVLIGKTYTCDVATKYDCWRTYFVVIHLLNFQEISGAGDLICAKLRFSNGIYLKNVIDAVIFLSVIENMNKPANFSLPAGHILILLHNLYISYFYNNYDKQTGMKTFTILMKNVLMTLNKDQTDECNYQETVDLFLKNSAKHINILLTRGQRNHPKNKDRYHANFHAEGLDRASMELAMTICKNTELLNARKSINTD